VEKSISKESPFYQIQVNTNGKNWLVERRFTEFIELAKALKSLLLIAPKLPPTKFFKLKSPAEIAERKEGLDKFLKELIVRPELLNQKIVSEFLMVFNPHNVDT